MHHAPLVVVAALLDFEVEVRAVAVAGVVEVGVEVASVIHLGGGDAVGSVVAVEPGQLAPM
jgi:hypothetical protein